MPNNALLAAMLLVTLSAFCRHSAARSAASGVLLTVSLTGLLPGGLAFYAAQFGSHFAAGCAAASLLLCGAAVAGPLGRLLPGRTLPSAVLLACFALRFVLPKGLLQGVLLLAAGALCRAGAQPPQAEGSAAAFALGAAAMTLGIAVLT